MTDCSWTPDPASAITTRFVQANGLTFELAECGSGPRLALCLHGFPELNFSWRHQMPLLAQKGWRVWAPNQRGYGASSRPEGVRAYALDNLTADVAALIDAAAAESPVKEVMLVAHDWGAIVAWAFAILKLRPLTKLVIMNVPHPKVAEREIRRWEQMKKSWYIFFFQLPWIPERALLAKDAEFVRGAFLNMAVDKSRFPKDVLDVYARAAQRPGAATAMVNWYRALIRHAKSITLGDGRTTFSPSAPVRAGCAPAASLRARRESGRGGGVSGRRHLRDPGLRAQEDARLRRALRRGSRGCAPVRLAHRECATFDWISPARHGAGDVDRLNGIYTNTLENNGRDFHERATLVGPHEIRLASGQDGDCQARAHRDRRKASRTRSFRAASLASPRTRRSTSMPCPSGC
jgi:pimeloyl-ACP methyl ester carboxylesterase